MTELHDTGYPAFPSGGNSGFTKRQYAAIKLQVPDSGTDWLDEMIVRAKRDEFAGTIAKDAYIIADAGTVYHQTGLTPRRLVERVKELEDALRELLDREWQDDEGDYTLEQARKKARAALAAQGGRDA